jgi:hypothetical protein
MHIKPRCRIRQDRRAMNEPETPPLLEQLLLLADDSHEERVRVSDLFSVLKDGSVVVLVLLFALPSALPMPPGTSAVIGAPLLILTIEWALGTRPWLPRLLARRSLPRPAFASLLHRVSRWSKPVDRLLKPRWQALAHPLARRLVAALCVVLATIILLPIPFGNMPPAWSISIVALGTLRRDGVWILAGSTAGMASIALVWGVALPLVKAALTYLVALFG